MGDKTGIEWTDATWNPIVGCSIVSPGCIHCYAMKQAARIVAMNPKSHYAKTIRMVKDKAVWTGKLTLAPDRTMTAPLRWKKPRRIFVNSMGDLFHDDVPDEWLDKVFAVMALSPRHKFQVLTKRSRRMQQYASHIEIREAVIEGYVSQHCGKRSPESDRFSWPLPNVHLGVSCEDQSRADDRIPDLLATPAAIRFVSAEPLLGPIDFMSIAVTRDRPQQMFPNWIIVGGESGPGARPMHPDWARSIRDQCAAAGVPFFFKQWGAWAPHKVMPGGDLGGDVRADRVRIVHPTGQSDIEVAEATGGRSTVPGSRYMARVGKHRADRLLDGRTHEEFPQ